MQLEKLVLLGHSMGGFLAASYAIQYPNRVEHLILADPWGFPERPSEITNKTNIPIWVKAIAYLVQPLNPLWAVRFAGPFGIKNFIFIFLNENLNSNFFCICIDLFINFFLRSMAY